jgi:hypothetical protein
VSRDASETSACRDPSGRSKRLSDGPGREKEDGGIEGMAAETRTLGSGGSNAPGGTRDEDWDRDLHGDDRAGQHAGVHDVRTFRGDDVKALYDRFPDFTKDDLKRIFVLAQGERLEQGAVYLDLSEETREPFVAQGGMEAQEPHIYVPKALVDYETWNRLTGTKR